MIHIITLATLLCMASSTLAVPLTKQTRRQLIKPECPPHTLQVIEEEFATLPSPRRFHSLLASADGGAADAAAAGIAGILGQSAVASCRVTIPVQFNNYHVQDSTSREDGYITDAQFQTALARINVDYAANTDTQFSLLRINRIPVSSSYWASMEVTSADMATHERIGETIKGANPSQDVTAVLHVNIVQDADACGFTYLPTASWSRSSLLRDAVVLDTKCFDGAEQFRSTTFTHEVGHWLGLYHTFEGGCSGSGDYVDDTPPAVAPVDEPTSLYDNCATPAATTSCGSANQTDIDISLSNYMSYSVNECRTNFTPGQTGRMSAVLSAARGYITC